MPAVISLGAGVQSTVMLMMAAQGEFGPKPEVAIFADTGWEPQHVYDHLDWLEREVGNYIEIVRVSAGNIRDDLVGFAEGTAKRYASPPVFIHGKRGSGMLQRQCTREYKIQPIERELRRRGYGGRRLKEVEQWIGISLDEVQRMKPSRTPWTISRWPLIERRMTRFDCLTWWEDRFPGQQLVKSACIGCPYHSDDTWREIRSSARRLG